MKILIVGEWAWPIYEESFASGLRCCRVEVLKFSTSIYFSGLFARIQKTIPIPGAAMQRLNRSVIATAVTHNPDFILFWRPTHIFPKTIIKLNEMGFKTVSYNNDDPFGPIAHGNVPWHHHFLWYWYLRSLSRFDFNFFYRKINCEEAEQIGAKHAKVLLPYFVPERDRPIILFESELQQFETDIVFVGHHESDGRLEALLALVNCGFRLRVWGGNWTHSVAGDLIDRIPAITLAEGEAYVKALCGAQVCLCFLSKLNRDTYTRRCFEIPACGQVMLAERTDDLIKLFADNEEACFFSSTEELLEKARWLVQNPDIRLRIARAGLRRVWAGGHDVSSRAKQFLEMIDA